LKKGDLGGFKNHQWQGFWANALGKWLTTDDGGKVEKWSRPKGKGIDPSWMWEVFASKNSFGSEPISALPPLLRWMLKMSGSDHRFTAPRRPMLPGPFSLPTR